MEIDPAIRRALMPRLLTFEVHDTLYSARQWNFRDWNFVLRRWHSPSPAMFANAGNGTWDEHGRTVNTNMLSRDQLYALADGLREANSFPDAMASIQGNLGDVCMVQADGAELYMQRLTREQYEQKREEFGLENVIEAVFRDANGRRVFHHPNDYSYLAAAPIVGVGRLALKLAREEFGDLPRQ